MRVVIQRVNGAGVWVDGSICGEIETGLLVLVGIEDADTTADVAWLSHKIVQMRIFNDANGVMNLSVKDIGGNILLISQFTLQAATKKGNRPSYIKASKPENAVPLYRQLIATLENTLQKPIQTGVFGAHMQVQLVNNGPVTIFMDSKNPDL